MAPRTSDDHDSIDKEKTAQIEDVSSAEELFHYTPKEAAKIRHRIDWRLIPALGLMYGVSLMDRKNVSNAYIAGMRADLNLRVGVRYSLITLVFFITYTLFQPPMTVLCRKIGPRIFLPGICLAWGIVIIGFGFSQNWTTLVGLRLVLGLLEAGYFPGCVYLMSTWYSRYEVARRYSCFYLIGSLASALSGILAYGLMQMEGTAGIRGWRWIFIMEGVITCALAMIGYVFLVRFPDQEKEKPSFKFLSSDEAAYVVHKINKDRGDVEAEPFHLGRFLKPAKDIEIWGFALIFLCTTTVTYGFSFFLPIILQENLGYSVAASQCLVAPPYVLAAILMYGMSWIGDKKRTRAPIIIVNSIISVVGLAILGFAKNPGVQYFGIFIGVAGCNANIPGTMAYQANNIRGQWRRAFCSATLTGFGGIGGIAGSLIFRSQDAPGYVPGIIGTIVANVLIIIVAVLLTILFRARNAKADRGELVIEELEEFRYTI
ncbi:MFS transporter-like protein 158 [Elsinoe australis]|uniref:MFS transporter-like protein 158 n=1 Tax=Elsinoe australis TaxID=40998 RepID=A0A4U7AWF1_9PEZI|nr:MFS transporter-like protein 158 [Elsinoe australis]